MTVVAFGLFLLKKILALIIILSSISNDTGHGKITWKFGPVKRQQIQYFIDISNSYLEFIQVDRITNQFKTILTKLSLNRNFYIPM